MRPNLIDCCDQQTLCSLCQVKNKILEEEIHCPPEASVLLASYAVHAKVRASRCPVLAGLSSISISGHPSAVYMPILPDMYFFQLSLKIQNSQTHP